MHDLECAHPRTFSPLTTYAFGYRSPDRSHMISPDAATIPRSSLLLFGVNMLTAADGDPVRVHDPLCFGFPVRFNAQVSVAVKHKTLPFFTDCLVQETERNEDLKGACLPSFYQPSPSHTSNLTIQTKIPKSSSHTGKPQSLCMCQQQHAAPNLSVTLAPQ